MSKITCYLKTIACREFRLNMLVSYFWDIFLRHCSEDITEDISRLRSASFTRNKVSWWTPFQMFRGTSSSGPMSIGILERSLLLHMRRKVTTGLRVDLFIPLMTISPQVQLESAPPQLATG